MNVVGAIGYGIAAAAFMLLAVLMMVSWRGRRPGVYLITASVITAAWALLLTGQAFIGRAAMLPLYLAEVLRNGAWLFALCAIAGNNAPTGLKLLARAAPVLALLALPVLSVLQSRGYLLLPPELLLSRMGLATSLLGLILLEQIFRNSGEAARDSLKYFVCGVGALFAFDLFLYSQAELLRGIMADAWNARGAIIAFAAPLIAIAVQREPRWSLDVFVSRQAVFYTTTFMGVGAYLLLMAAGGYYVRDFGGSWGRLGQIVFFGGALLLLVLLVGSSVLRRRARVFLSKHFYRNKYDYRLEWLRFISTLSSGDEEDVRRTAVAAIAQIFSSPAGILWLADESGGRFVPAAAWPGRLDEIEGLEPLPASADLPAFLARTQWIVDLQELERAPDMYGNFVLPDWLNARRGFRIVSPLLQLERLMGFVLLYEPPPPFELTYEDRDLLKTVGRHVATHIAQQEADRKLTESRQFEAYNRLTAFMMHDLKNSAAQLRLIVDNYERHKRNPEFIDDAIGTIGNAVERMTRLIDQLRGSSAPERVVRVDLPEIAREAARRCEERRPRPVLQELTAALVQANPERLTTVVEHVIRNAQDATSAGGTVTVAVRQDGGVAQLIVSDTGLGMDADFVRDRLFRPFDSTKGAKGMGIGAYQVREYIHRLSGSVEVQSSPGQGTRFTIMIPACEPARATPAVAGATGPG
ncbi:MAG TPA: XrtA/PEP-CTERM system histidine kinase PrsK [Steroidobacteraceae bacterium]|nr:XrtA/PEP-CTERM system histidine kinase PrsK [Steroidobacteraceae bacterium]